MAESRNTTARTRAPLARLFGTPDIRMRGELHAELRADRDECDRKMRGIIASALRREPYLSSSIFCEIGVLEKHLSSAEAAYLSISDRRRPRDVRDQAIVAVYEMMVMELHIAELLREARMLVSHADPADYWQTMESLWAAGRGFAKDRAHGR